MEQFLNLRRRQIHCFSLTNTNLLTVQVSPGRHWENIEGVDLEKILFRDRCQNTSQNSRVASPFGISVVLVVFSWYFTN
jgi:hypothetical protein